MNPTTQPIEKGEELMKARESSLIADAATPKNAAFAPGPWSFEGPLLPGRTYRIRSSRGLVTYVGDPVTFSFDLGNARLIAAAPELLEEAREICAILDMYRADTGEEPCFDHEAIGEEVARRHDSLTAAIAMATGQ